VIPKKAGDRVKTDRRTPCNGPAHALRDLTPVYARCRR
jgi:hypothetical protein